MTTLALEVRELTVEEVELIGGGPRRGVAVSAGVGVGYVAGIAGAVEGAHLGAMYGAWGGPVGFFVGAAAGMAVGYVAYQLVAGGTAPLNKEK